MPVRSTSSWLWFWVGWLWKRCYWLVAMKVVGLAASWPHKVMPDAVALVAAARNVTLALAIVAP